MIFANEDTISTIISIHPPRVCKRPGKEYRTKFRQQHSHVVLLRFTTMLDQLALTSFRNVYIMT